MNCAPVRRTVEDSSLDVEGRQGVGSRPRAPWAQRTSVVIGAALLGCTGTSPATVTEVAPAGPVVEVSVSAADVHGTTLNFTWRASDGTITDVNASTTTWRLPPGPGVHFAYVLVGNGKGGYTERRVAVSTDSIGVPRGSRSPQAFAPPADSRSPTYSYRGTIRGAGYYGVDRNGIYLPDVSVKLRNVVTGEDSTVATSDLRGTFVIDDLSPGTYDRLCQDAGQVGFVPCPSYGDTPDGTAPIPVVIGGEARNEANPGPIGRGLAFTGRVVLEDGTPCGTTNEFFGVEVGALVTMLDAGGQVIAGPFRVNAFGHYGFAAHPSAASIRIECEALAPITIPALAGGEPRTVLSETAAPLVTSMSATLDGTEVGVFLPPPSGGPSDAVSDPEFFLSAKGLDSRLSACRYYMAIGAVRSCDPSGVPSGAISFDDWRRQVGMDQPGPPGRVEYVATYINRVDLNLTRQHHAVSRNPGEVAAYVCNHLGPRSESQADADAAIEAAVDGRNLVACVAMDHTATPGVNGGAPFTKFLIFGPSGNLLPSVNLDGRREKFAPGVCVACHGGDRYAGRFPVAGAANIGAHFLPYDSGNFTFSSRAPLRVSDQEASIRSLNLTVLESSPTPATSDLIAGWYASGTGILDRDFVPPSWRGKPPAELTFYRRVYAASCRTCHVAFTERLNFDHYPNVDLIDGLYDNPNDIARSTCDGGSYAFVRNFSMPNSLRTHELFWKSAGTVDDGPAALGAFLEFHFGSGPCQITRSPNP